MANYYKNFVISQSQTSFLVWLLFPIFSQQSEILKLRIVHELTWGTASRKRRETASLLRSVV